MPLVLRPPNHPVPDASLGAFRHRAAALAPPSAPHLHRHLRWLLANAPASCTSGRSTPSTPGTRRSTSSSVSVSIFARGVSSSSTAKDPHRPPPVCSRGSQLCWAQHEHPKQIISIHNQWNCYKAPEEGEAKRARSQQLFSVRKCSVLQNNREAEVYYVLVCGVLLVVSLFEHVWRPLKWFVVAHHGRQHTHAHRSYLRRVSYMGKQSSSMLLLWQVGSWTICALLDTSSLYCCCINAEILVHLYTIFEVQAYASMLAGGALSFNLVFPSSEPDIWRLMWMWCIWMFSCCCYDGRSEEAWRCAPQL
ncbi:uncharacterized protein [Triticum aestivum]|uniref:uncharacterized protein n=1 Tax=Triticum aestivum TaxID=4565 RepID=UPI001D007966|nr:uncharacterized protein LOC123096966 [Triticum aestivum]